MHANNRRCRVTIYTDGACRGNPGPGGWGALLIYAQNQKTLKGAAAETTNNRMELQAAIAALAALKHACRVSIHTDSTYVRDGVTRWMQNWKQKNWKTANKQPVKNQDLWRELDQLQQLHEVDWHWVKGHAGVPGNERADALANQAIDEMLGRAS